MKKFEGVKNYGSDYTFILNYDGEGQHYKIYNHGAIRRRIDESEYEEIAQTGNTVIFEIDEDDRKRCIKRFKNKKKKSRSSDLYLKERGLYA